MKKQRVRKNSSLPESVMRLLDFPPERPFSLEEANALKKDAKVKARLYSALLRESRDVIHSVYRNFCCHSELLSEEIIQLRKLAAVQEKANSLSVKKREKFLANQGFPQYLACKKCGTRISRKNRVAVETRLCGGLVCSPKTPRLGKKKAMYTHVSIVSGGAPGGGKKR
mgnify:CR=1 FL=1